MTSSTSPTSPDAPDEITEDAVKSPDLPSLSITVSRLKGRQMVNSKMAKRLLRINMMLAGLPLVIAVTILIFVTHVHMIGMSHTINRYNAETVRDAGHTFHQMATQAVHSSVEQTQQISVDTIRSMTRKMSQDEAASLSTTERDFANLTRTNFDDAMRRSLETNGQTVAAIRQQMSAAFTRSSQQTQSQAAGNVEKAMLALTDTMMAERARQLSGIVSDRINTNLSYLSLTAQMPALSEGDAKGAKATLDALVRRHPSIMLAATLDREGHEIAVSASDRSVTAQELATRANEAYFRTAISGGTYSGLDSVPVARSAPVLRLAIPIEAYRGKVVGVLSARLSLEDLWDTIRTTVVGHHGFAYVVDQQGHPLLPPRPAFRIDTRLESSSVVEGLDWRVVVAIPRSEAMQPILALKHDIDSNSKAALAEIQSGMTRSAQVASTHMQHETQMIRDSTEQRMQERSQTVFKRLTSDMRSHVDKSLAGMQGTVSRQAAVNEARTTRKMQQQAQRTEGELTGHMQGLTDDALLSGDRSMVLVALCIVLASCGVAGMLALFTARRIVQPVVDLAEVTQAIARGDLERRVDENAADEIGDLAVAFNTMAASLQKSRAELHTAESQLVQSAKLASLGTLSAGVAHELNQPLAIIRGLAQQLQDEPGLDEDILADLEIIEGQTSRMSKIIKHMRTFCRTGNQEMVPVEVHRVIQDTLLLVGEQLRQHNVELRFEFCHGQPIILGDANELEQVVLNLITNARDVLDGRPDACITIRSYIKNQTEPPLIPAQSIEAGGDVSPLRLRGVVQQRGGGSTTEAASKDTSAEADGAGARLVLEFADNGPGIPEQIADQIFDPFFTTKEAGKGTGLGLSISHTIITRHRGEMRVTNANGAVFILDLPLAEHRIESLPVAA